MERTQELDERVLKERLRDRTGFLWRETDLIALDKAVRSLERRSRHPKPSRGPTVAVPNGFLPIRRPWGETFGSAGLAEGRCGGLLMVGTELAGSDVGPWTPSALLALSATLPFTYRHFRRARPEPAKDAGRAACLPAAGESTLPSAPIRVGELVQLTRADVTN